ncbi:UvrD-helicase domain-containing protein, partial [candidate division KSB1 bacterium]
MMLPVKKIIRASAGTGKTYRLSLEYIGLLLQYSRHGLHFSEILVITFTKKATAEIRERIFDHLHHILSRDSEGVQLMRHLESFFALKITDKDLAALCDIHVDMLTNKHLVQISTIDSFTNTIFKTIISPYLGIIDYEVQPTLDDKTRDELYRTILEDKDRLATFRAFFERTELKTIADYEQFIDSVIRNRWAFHLVSASTPTRPFAGAVIETDALCKRFREEFAAFARDLQDYLNAEYAEKRLNDVLNTDYVNLVSEIMPAAGIADVSSAFCGLIEDEETLLKNHALLLDEKKNIWNGARILRKKSDAATKEHLIETLQRARLLLADYLFAKLLLPEEQDLLHIVAAILDKYDQLKFRDRIFTHDDISYYTFKYLYDPELSLIEGDSVSNSFYEYLSTYTRFILIDEFQDTSIIQYKIVSPIIREVSSGAGVKEYGGVILVGDEKQSIYGWRGGERDLLLTMPTAMPDSQQLTLDTSYRSDENIIGLINAIFDHPALHEQLKTMKIDWPYTPVRAAKANGAGYAEIYLRNTTTSKGMDNAISSPTEAIREFLQQTLHSPAYKDHLRGKTAILARRNVDLDDFATALDELGIPYMQESSTSLLDHRAIKPVYLLLHYLVYGDFFDLLRFLRSDAVLLDTTELKQLLLAFRDAQDKSDVPAILEACAHIPAVRQVRRFMASIAMHDDPFSVVQKIIEEYNIIGRFALQSDNKNVHQFLLHASGFGAKGEYEKSLAGFLDYCRQEKDRESFSQVGLEDSDAIALMTIHKSKGLEFDNVLLYWNLSGGNQSVRQLRPYLHYSPDYGAVNNYLYTFNYDKIVSQSSQRHFIAESERRLAIEELNTLYVALTRAKSNLFLCITYQKSGGFENMLGDAKKEKEMATLFIEHLRTVFQQNYEFIHFDENRERGYMGQLGAA